MSGETLLASKAVKLHSFFKRQLAQLGFSYVFATDAGSEGLILLIGDMKPRLVLIDSNLHDCCTPFRAIRLLKQYPALNVAAVSFGDYPARLAAGFIANGIKSYACFYDGEEEFCPGMRCIRDGKEYISPAVLELMDQRSAQPAPAGELTPRQLAVLRALCNGFKTLEIAETAGISIRTVEHHKDELYKRLNARNENELIRVALKLGIIGLDELAFYK